ncbi:hypothetical protein EST38_g10967 [Candolleomyces aberdarensis]|uniref:DUF221-domain-containing protein n=1 Tax=Candolleomyces aberdarensis TaxID=2316362 RepID=A0A4Q2D615_9AGAR|nr:hypothetical protein EST38_g10967 [Candolleomyces aberdarensis]
MSGIEDAADNIFNDRSRTLAPTAVASQVALMSVVSIVIILFFNILRPKNKIIYEPKVKYQDKNKPLPRITNHLFGWLPPLVNTKEPELLEKIGLDAVAFLRFNRLLRWLFTGVVVLTCGVLIPINVVYNLKNVKPKQRDYLSMLTIRDVQGDFLYAHVVVTYLITILIIVTVWYHWRAMIRLRHSWFRSDEYRNSFHARTLQVTHVPKKVQTDDGLRGIFDGLGMPYPTTSVHIGRKTGRLPELIEYHNTTVQDFERVLVQYMKGGKLKAKRPTVPERGGAGCCGGRKNDAIESYSRKLKKIEEAVEEHRDKIDDEKPKNYGFATLASVPYAHIVARKLEGKHFKGTTISLAPNPKDIIWNNMDKTDGEIARKRTIGVLWLVFVCFFNTIPLFVISVLANLDGIRGWVPFLEDWANKSPNTFSLVSGVLPAAVSTLFGFFLPVIMRWLTKFMGALTYSSLDRAVVARYFAFLIISQLVIFTLIGVLFNCVKEIIFAIGNRVSFKEIIANLDDLPNKIHRTYINQASYWLTYFPLRGALVIFDLAQVLNLVWLSFRTRVFGRTPREIREWTKPPIFQYAIFYSNILFMAAVGLVFAPLAPLVAVAACVVFWVGSCVYKYQLMFLYVTRVESGGRMWNVVVNRLLFCVLLMQSLMILTIGLQKGFMTFIWVSAVPPILLILIFKIYINRVFVPAFHYFNPSLEEINTAEKHRDSSSNKLEKRFGHPSLHEGLFTTSIHKDHVPLLTQIYPGKYNTVTAPISEYGGQTMQIFITSSGLKIAGIGKNDLEYDAALYHRERGELDWDQRSISSTNMLDNASMISGHLPRGSVSKFSGYDEYLTKGPSHQQHGIELTKIDSMTEPLLDSRGPPFQRQAMDSQQTLASPPSLYQYPNGSAVSRDLYRPQEGNWSPSPAYQSTETLHQSGPSPTFNGYVQSPDSFQTHQYPPQHQRQPSNNVLAGYQNRSQTPSSSGHSPNPSQQYPPNQHARQMSGNMLASGRHSPGPNQGYARTPSPGPNQAYGRAPSPGPNQAYGQAPGPYQAYGRSPSPGVNRAYGNTSPSSAYNQHPPQHLRNPSENMLSSPQRPSVNTQVPSQQHGRSPSGNLLHAYPQQQQRGPSPQQQPWQR